ncbi:hypothetical protein [Nannocystis bainbridge]|uniref:Uncharacterized protein n=1 Tax=Nannocystis bainbridge TaxID=2995303 RepID=A0ABT5E8E8_9BACT|nr:hypothetical protein [Nannocystis bainbridge]MDC0721173.1 hypothetical protein [Nannocystis bainbridge]
MRLGRAGEGLLHPAALASVAVLLLNDHWAKRAYPGFATGKLSDFAGLIFTPLLLDAWIELGLRQAGRYRGPSPRRLRALAVLTGLVFALAKTWPPANIAVAWAMGLVRLPLDAGLALALGRGLPALGPVALVRDPSDLLALPSLGLALWVGRRR